jgi:hypothetical protein
MITVQASKETLGPIEAEPMEAAEALTAEVVGAEAV